MTVAIRTPLIAATAAALTATAVTVTGVSAGSADLPVVRVPALAEVGLAAFASPLLEIYDTIQKANLYTFSIAEPPVTQFDRAGIIPDFLAAGFPIVTQYFLNAPDYINQTLNYVFQDLNPNVAPLPTDYPGALRVLTWAAQALPQNVGVAAQQLFAGNLVGALGTLRFAVANPIQAALYQTLNAGLYALGGLGARAAAVITEIAEWVPTTIRNLADDVTVVLNAATNVLGNVAFGIQTLNIETVWNALVVGVLGTSPNLATPTIPDALINQTIGEGGRIYTVPGQPGFIEVPSMRQNLTDLRDNIADALATDVPVPENPPFPVTPPGSFVPSQIPTPWQPTPVPAATVASVRAAASAAAGDDASAADAPAAASRSVSAVDVAGTAGPARSIRAADAGTAKSPASLSEKPARSVAARSASR